MDSGSNNVSLPPPPPSVLRSSPSLHHASMSSQSPGATPSDVAGPSLPTPAPRPPLVMYGGNSHNPGSMMPTTPKVREVKRLRCSEVVIAPVHMATIRVPTTESVNKSFPSLAQSKIVPRRILNMKLETNYSLLFPNIMFDCYHTILPWIAFASRDAYEVVTHMLPPSGPILANDFGLFLSYLVFVYDLKHMVVPRLTEHMIRGYGFLHFDASRTVNVMVAIEKLLGFNGFVGGITATEMIDQAQAVGAAVIAANEASTEFRQELGAYIKVSVLLSAEDMSIITRERKDIRFLAQKSVTNDHPLMAAYREIIRADYESIVQIKNTNMRTLVLGAASREYRTYNSNPNIYFQIANREGKDVDRLVLDLLEELRKAKAIKIQKKLVDIASIQRARNEVRELQQMIYEWRTYKKIPARFIMWEESQVLFNKGRVCRYNDHGEALHDSSCPWYERLNSVFKGATDMYIPVRDTHRDLATFDQLVFEDVGYNFFETDWYKIFKNTGAITAYGYMCLPWQLAFPDMVSPPGYVFKVQGQYAHLAYPGYSNGYVHNYKAWSTIMRTPVIVGAEFSIGIEMVARAGPMACVKMYKMQSGERMTRVLALPPFLCTVQILNIHQSMDKNGHFRNTFNFKYFAIKREEFYDALNYALDIAQDSLSFRSVMIFIRRKCAGMSLVNRDLSKSWTCDRALIPEFSLVVFLYATRIHQKYKNFEEDAKVTKVRALFQRVFRYLELPKKCYDAFWDFFHSETFLDHLVKDFDNSFWQSRKARTTRYTRIDVFAGVPDEKLLDDSRDYSELEIPVKQECMFCEDLKNAVGRQKFRCRRDVPEIYYHDFALSSDDLAKLRTKLRATASDPVGLKATKEKALAKVPAAPFSHTVRVRYICGPPGTGKSYAIRGMATGDDLVVAPFARLREDYQYFTHENFVGVRSLNFSTHHNAFDAMNHSTIYVDEYTAMPYECLAIILFNCGASEVVLVGDHRQTWLINEVEGIAMNSRIDFSRLRTHELVKNYRNPSDTVALLNTNYGYEMESTNNRVGYKFGLTSEFEHYRLSHTPLFFKYTSAEALGIPKDTTEKVTVRANQGATFDKVVLVVANDDFKLFSMASMAIVALSRHRLECVILYDDGAAAIFAGTVRSGLPGGGPSADDESSKGGGGPDSTKKKTKGDDRRKPDNGPDDGGQGGDPASLGEKPKDKPSVVDDKAVDEQPKVDQGPPTQDEQQTVFGKQRVPEGLSKRAEAPKRVQHKRMDTSTGPVFTSEALSEDESDFEEDDKKFPKSNTPSVSLEMPTKKKDPKPVTKKPEQVGKPSILGRPTNPFSSFFQSLRKDKIDQRPVTADSEHTGGMLGNVLQYAKWRPSLLRRSEPPLNTPAVGEPSEAVDEYADMPPLAEDSDSEQFMSWGDIADDEDRKQQEDTRPHEAGVVEPVLTTAGVETTSDIDVLSGDTPTGDILVNSDGQEATLHNQPDFESTSKQDHGSESAVGPSGGPQLKPVDFDATKSHYSGGFSVFSDASSSGSEPPGSNACLLTAISDATGVAKKILYRAFKKVLGNDIRRLMEEEGGLTTQHLGAFCEAGGFRLRVYNAGTGEMYVCGKHGDIVATIRYSHENGVGHFSPVPAGADENRHALINRIYPTFGSGRVGDVSTSAATRALLRLERKSKTRKDKSKVVTKDGSEHNLFIRTGLDVSSGTESSTSAASNVSARTGQLSPSLVRAARAKQDSPTIVEGEGSDYTTVTAGLEEGSHSLYTGDVELNNPVEETKLSSDNVEFVGPILPDTEDVSAPAPPVEKTKSPDLEVGVDESVDQSSIHGLRRVSVPGPTHSSRVTPDEPHQSSEHMASVEIIEEQMAGLKLSADGRESETPRVDGREREEEGSTPTLSTKSPTGPKAQLTPLSLREKISLVNRAINDFTRGVGDEGSLSSSTVRHDNKDDGYVYNFLRDRSRTSYDIQSQKSVIEDMLDVRGLLDDPNRHMTWTEGILRQTNLAGYRPQYMSRIPMSARDVNTRNGTKRIHNLLPEIDTIFGLAIEQMATRFWIKWYYKHLDSGCKEQVVGRWPRFDDDPSDESQYGGNSAKIPRSSNWCGYLLSWNNVTGSSRHHWSGGNSTQGPVDLEIEGLISEYRNLGTTRSSDPEFSIAYREMELREKILKLCKVKKYIPVLRGGAETVIKPVPKILVPGLQPAAPEPLVNSDPSFVLMARLFTDPVKVTEYLVELLPSDIDSFRALEQTPFDAFTALLEEFTTADEFDIDLTNQESLVHYGEKFGTGIFDLRTEDGINQRGHLKPNRERAWTLLAVSPGVTYFKNNLWQALHCLQSRYLTKTMSVMFSYESVRKAIEIADLFFDEHMSSDVDFLNEQDVWETTMESEHSMKIKNYEAQVKYHLDGDIDVRFNMKDIFKPFKTKIDIFKAGQGISAWSKDTQTIFQTSFRIINKIFIACLKDHVVYDNGIDEITMMNRVNALLSALPDVCVNGVIDATACDSGQNRFTQAIERRILERMGVSDDFLEWYYSFREKYTLKGYGVVASIRDIKTSGEPATLLNNTILMAALMNYLIRGEGPCVLVIKGDDGLKRQANLVFDRQLKDSMSRYLKMEFKVDINVPITFCGYFLSGSILVPDVMRKVFKVLGHRFRDYNHFREYQQSLRDWILNVNKIGINDACQLAASAYTLEFDYCHSLFAALVSLSHISSDQFYKHFQLRTFDWSQPAPKVEKWSQQADWYEGGN